MDWNVRIAGLKTSCPNGRTNSSPCLPEAIAREFLISSPQMRYAVILEREPDGGYVALVPVLPGCVSQGDTREEALRNIHEAADLYVEDCIESGDPVPVETAREYLELVTGPR